MKKYILISIIVFSALWFLNGEKAYGASSIVIDSSQVRQKIEGMGGNYPFGYNSSEYSNPAVAQYTMDNLKPSHVRVFFASADFEPSNDNGDPNSFNWSGFKDSGLVNGQFLFLQDAKARGIAEDNIILSPWVMPDWMKTTTPAIIIPTYMYDEAIEVIAATLVRARDTYGVNIKYIQFNEPNQLGPDTQGWGEYFSPTEMCNFIKKAGPRFAALGLNVKWLTGDTWNASGLVNYAQPQLEDAACRQYLGPISFHSWDGGSPTDANLTNIYNLASQYGLPVWCEEVGLSSSDTDNRTTWSYALSLASRYYQLLKFARVSATSYWVYGSWDIWDPVNNSTMIPYPSFYVLKQLSDNLPVGTDIIEANSSDSELLVLAGKKDSTGHFIVQVINRGWSSKDVTFSGLPNSAFTLVRTSQSENMNTIGSYAASGGQLTVSLPAQSISTFTTTASIPSTYCDDGSCNGTETCSSCPSDCGACPNLTNNSQFVSQSVPSQMTAGSNYTVSIAMKNIGASVWTDSDMYYLGSQNPYDNTTWGMHRVLLGSSEAINPGQTKIFTFSVTAPTTLGTYNFQWRMVKETVEWFGDLTPNISVSVISQAPYCGDFSCNGTETCSFCPQDCGSCPSTNPIAHWKFDDGSGTTAYDSSGNGNTGTLVNGPVWTTGKLSGALSFNGTSNYVDMGTSLSIISPITISVWVNTSFLGINQQIISKGYEGFNTQWEFKITSASGQVSFQTYSNGSVRGVQSVSSLNVNTWTLITGTYDGSTWRIYWNGSLNNSQTDLGPAATNKKLLVGAVDINGTPGQFWHGLIDDVRIYNRALSESEIQSLYQSGVDTTPPASPTGVQIQ